MHCFSAPITVNTRTVASAVRSEARRACSGPSSVMTAHSRSRTTTVTMTGTPWAAARCSGDVSPSYDQPDEHHNTDEGCRSAPGGECVTGPVPVGRRRWRPRAGGG